MSRITDLVVGWELKQDDVNNFQVVGKMLRKL